MLAPLRDLRIASGDRTLPQAGYSKDAVAGTKRHMTAAQKFAPTFGIASECRISRVRTKAAVMDILRVHAAAASLTQSTKISANIVGEVDHAEVVRNNASATAATLMARRRGGAGDKLIFTTISAPQSETVVNLYQPWADRVNAAGKGVVQIDTRHGFTLVNSGNFLIVCWKTWSRSALAT